MKHKVELYFWQNGMESAIISNKSPKPKGSGYTTAPDAVSRSLCRDGMAMFGLRDGMFTGNKIIKMVLTIESMEAGTSKVVTSFGPMPTARKKKATKK